MTWVKLDDRFFDHPKVHQLGVFAPVGASLFLSGCCYAATHRTDGFLPKIVIPTLVLGLKRPYSIADRLVAVELWHVVDPDTYRIHDFLDYNPSRAQVDSMTDQRRAAGHNGGIASGEARREASRLPEPKPLASSQTKPVTTVTVTPVTSRPITPLSARDGLPNLDDAALLVLEDVTGRSRSLAGDRQLTEFDRLVGDYGLPKVRAALEAAARESATRPPTARQVVWGAMKILEPMPSLKGMAQRERDAEADRASRAGFERTRRELDADPLYQKLREQDRRPA